MRTLVIRRPAWAWGRNGELTPHEITVDAGPVPARFADDPTAAPGVGIHVYSKRGASMGTSPIDLELTAADALTLAAAIIEATLCPTCGLPLSVEGIVPLAGAEADDEPVHVFCDICGKAEHPADLTPDWNGKTGNHLSCEGSIR